MPCWGSPHPCTGPVYFQYKSRTSVLGLEKKFQYDQVILDIFTIYSTEPPFSRILMIFTTRPRSYWKSYTAAGYFQVQVQFAFQHGCACCTCIFPESFPETNPHPFWLCAEARTYWKFENTLQAISYFFLAFSKWTLPYLEKYRMNTRTGFSFSPVFTCFFFSMDATFVLEIQTGNFQATFPVHECE